jgi:hypothetical protein
MLFFIHIVRGFILLISYCMIVVNKLNLLSLTNGKILVMEFMKEYVNRMNIKLDLIAFKMFPII